MDSYNKNYVEFYNGHKMPIVGLGTWQGTEAEMNLAIKTALKLGYRHIDTAFAYNNEVGIGKALKEVFAEGKIKREDVFIVTKLPSCGLRPEHVKYFLEKSLKNLQLDYLDLYLIHNPVGFQYVSDTSLFSFDDKGNALIDPKTDLVATWKKMEEMVDAKLVKSIGVSNFGTGQIQRILDNSRIKPANNQVELHAYFQQRKLVDFCHKNGITVCAFSPIGSPGTPANFQQRFGVTVEFPSLMKDPALTPLAEKYKKTPSQILLRFLTQRGIVVIPKSTNPDRIKQNFEILDFTLTPEEMKIMFSLDKEHGRLFDFKFFKGFDKHPEYNGVFE